MDVKPASFFAGTSGTIVLCAGPPWAAYNAADKAIAVQKPEAIANGRIRVPPGE
jgi:hypothetical protein